MKTNLILNTDSYKASHYLQYPPGTTHVSSYIEPRGGDYPQVLFFGLQMFIKEYLMSPFTAGDIDEAEPLLTAHGEPFNREGWEYILERHGGYLPLQIEAVPEGTVLPINNVVLQVVNTDPKCAWLTSYIETALLRAVWYPSTVATRSWYCKQTIARYLRDTAGTTRGLDFMLHDFGARGVSSNESARIGGLAHLVNFHGTDTLAALLAARDYYAEPLAAYSIPAAEHSTIVCWGRDNEQSAYEHLLEQFSGPGKKLSVVADSYDLWRALDIWGGPLRDRVREGGGTVVIRPDSGDPAPVVTETIARLMRTFGFTLNHKQFRVLPPHVRVIQGDGINPDSIAAILHAMHERGQSAENIVFGMGGQLLQKLDRDTMHWAMKASATRRDNEWHAVAKDPATDSGKRSKPGRLALVKDDEGWRTVRLEQLRGDNMLHPVFENGELLVDDPLALIRQRAGAACRGAAEAASGRR